MTTQLTKEELKRVLEEAYCGLSGGDIPADDFIKNIVTQFSAVINTRLVPKLEAELFESAKIMYNSGFLVKPAINMRLSEVYKDDELTMHAGECVWMFYAGVPIADIARLYFFKNFEKFVMVDQLYESYRNKTDS